MRHGEGARGTGETCVRPSVCATVAAEDPAVHERLSKPWELQIRPQGRPPYGYQRVQFVTPRVALYRERVSTRVKYLGLAPSTHLVIAAPIHQTEDSSFWGLSLRRNRLPAAAGTGVHVTFGSGLDHVVLMLHWDEVRSHLSPHTVAALEKGAASHWIPTSPRTSAALARWGADTLAATVSLPDLHLRPTAVRSVEEDAIGWVRRIARDSTPSEGHRTPRNQAKVVGAAIEFLRSADPDMVNVPAVAAATGVSRRTLEYAFREWLGTSVLGYIRQRRLHLARQELLHATRSGTRVGHVASRHGFYDHGRFAGTYRQHFGESPSTTLRRQPPAPQPSLA